MKRHSLLIKTSLFLLAFALFSFSALAQKARGNGNVIEQERELAAEFDIIKISHGLNLYIKQGSPAALMVKADENLMGQIITRVDGNTLHLDIKGSIRKPKALDIYLTLDALRELHASGGSDVFAEEGLKLDELEIHSSGGSDTKMRLEVESLECHTSGGSDLELMGTATNLEVHSSGGSDFNGKKLEAVNCKVFTSGASDVWVYATGEIEMEASGASDIHHKGGAKVISMKTSGGADIHSN